ncbi:XRE family transcriptional regulator [Prevotella intermedia]|uniref:helix-turn-helix domain-containing protein n=1 Tax=Prevotella intermedia TaxID=28131 RepID=UPI000C1BE735|nr:helix-turn-helix transcriptional regulator [Prevotella intermedia]ATV32510.1 XRE family transcriptional regulator [Prevotella intermedia]ATV41078.1 XRE family transcriptional regulator [Prevotella intermedia]
MEKETINDRVRYIIEKEGHTISSFARKIDIGDQTIRSITKDRNKPGYELIVKIIESFEWVDANWLVMGEKSEIDTDKKKLYSVISTQQKTIDSQQKTIDRLTAKLVQELSEEPSKKVANVG